MAGQRPYVLVLNAPGDPALPGLEALENRAEVRQVDSESALVDALPRTDILVVTDFRTDLLSRCWPAEHRIRWVHASSAGVDALMFPALRESGVVLTNARGVFDRGIAEYVLGAVLLFAKDTLGNLRHQRAHRWHHRNTRLIDGARALVVGAGSIGEEVARLLSAAGMRVCGTARSAREQPPFEAVYPNDALLELLPEQDYVVITAPLTDTTRGLFDRRAFAAMREGACLINVGRGPIVQTDALVEALESGRLAGAALDVFEEEPLPAGHPLWDQPGVMISAHMAGDFDGWQRALGEQFVANFDRWERGEVLFNLIDLETGFPAR